jgi:hypothetical protein
MLLTGTFGQYRALVPSVENGYFSRLMTMVIRGTHPFNKSYVSSKGAQSLIPRQVGQQLLRVYEQILNAPEREWSLTEAQKERLGEHLETEYGTLIGLLGENFHSAVIRMAIQIERIAMILTAMRGDSSLMSRAHNKEGMSEYDSDAKDKVILCRVEDYETAEMIGNKMLLHMAAAYRMIDGEGQECVPEIKPLDQRKVLFEQLKAEYKLQELIAEAKSQGVSRRSAIRWNDSWQENGMVLKLNHGNYKKVSYPEKSRHI